MQTTSRRNTWAIVLAGGDGTRLSELTSRLHGQVMPKQYARLLGDRSFLQETIRRTGSLFNADRTLVVVNREYRRIAREQLSRWPEVRLVVQPHNAGTAAGVLLPLAQMMATDPDACVVLMPCDHYVRDEARFLEAMVRAVEGVDHTPAGINLVGVPASSPATDMGWIRPGHQMGPAELGLHAVRRFVEKPRPDLAKRLFRAGASWNTLVVVARVSSLWREMQRLLPTLVEVFTPYTPLWRTPSGERYLRRQYQALFPVDFSRQFLQKVQGLGLINAQPCGWTDCGTEERLLEALPAGMLPGLEFSERRPPRISSPAIARFLDAGVSQSQQGAS